MSTTACRNLISIGRMVPIIQLLPDQIRELANELGIEPAMRIDNREMFAEADVEAMKAERERRMAKGGNRG